MIDFVENKDAIFSHLFGIYFFFLENSIIILQTKFANFGYINTKNWPNRKKCCVFFRLLFVLHDLSDITEGLDGEKKAGTQERTVFGAVISISHSHHKVSCHYFHKKTIPMVWPKAQTPILRHHATHYFVFIRANTMLFFPLLLPALC